MADLKISVVIVNFNCGELLTKCVRSVLASSVKVEVFVSDNGSTDASIHCLKAAIRDERLHIICNNRNLGFAKANNHMLAGAKGDYLLFLNPDCLIQRYTLEGLLTEMRVRPDVGMTGCLLLNSDGSEQAGGRRRVPTPWRTLVRILYMDKLFPDHPKFQNISLALTPLPDKPIEVEAVSGAFMLVRRTALEDVGPMDEGYFLHCEDLDWCMRFRQKGWHVLFVPDEAISHVKGACSRARPVRVEWHKHKSMVRFYRKFFRHQYPLPLMWCVICAVWLRFITIAIGYSLRRPVR